ncbi:hypothetical protein P4S72_23935 [Vibrio sp. PP-XX7]
MAQMVKDKHLDEPLFHLLLSSNVYQQYAARFLNESQCDDVDIRQYLASDP